MFSPFSSDRDHRMAVTAKMAAAYRTGTAAGEGSRYPRKAPSAAAHIPSRGTLATAATPKGANLPNTSPREHSIPPKKLAVLRMALRA